MLDDNQIALLELIKLSLFGLPPAIPISTDWDAVMREAEEQTVVGLVASVAPQEVAEKWRVLLARCESKFIRVLHGQSQLVQLFEEARIPLVILKGAAAAIYYPKPQYRMMGDIDFLVPTDQFESAARLMEANGFIPFLNLERQLDHSFTSRHIEFSKNGIEYELHHHFSFGGDAIDNTLLEGLRQTEKKQIGKIVFPVLPTMSNGLLLLSHVGAHLNTAELGLRQVIDWMMFVSHELDDEKWETCFCDMAREMGLEKLAIILTRLCCEFIGLQGSYKWCEDADKKTAEALMDFVFERGNFGRKYKQSADMEHVTALLGQRGVFRALKLKGTEIWKSRKVSESKKYIRPFVWARLFEKLIITRIKAGQGHMMKDIRSGYDLSKLYKELGLR